MLGDDARVWDAPFAHFPRSKRYLKGLKASSRAPGDGGIERWDPALRAVEARSRPTGYRLEIGPFPGWKDAHTC